MFIINSPLYVEPKWIEPSYPHQRDRFALSDFTFIEASPFMDNYNKCSYYNLDNYFQSAYLSGGGVIFASPYMAVQKPLLVTILKTCNPKSIKPNNYKRSKVINNDFNFTRNNLNLMRKAPEMCL